MIDYGNDKTSLNVKPVNFDKMGIVKYSEMNMLFYYEFRSTVSDQTFMRPRLMDPEKEKNAITFK